MKDFFDTVFWNQSIEFCTGENGESRKHVDDAHIGLHLTVCSDSKFEKGQIKLCYLLCTCILNANVVYPMFSCFVWL